ncbi:unnamed protein product [Cunninghamella blakesleeana]
MNRVLVLMNKHNSTKIQSAAHICQNLWLENQFSQIQTRRLSPYIYSSLRSVYTNTTCKQLNSPPLLLSIPKNIKATNKVKYSKWLKEQQYIINKQKHFYSTTTAINSQIQQQHNNNNNNNNTLSSSLNDLSNIPKDDLLIHSSSSINSGKILSAALEQSDLNIAHCLVDTALQLLKRKNPELAWECYSDISVRNMLRYITSDQYNQLIIQFAHQTKHGQGLSYVLALVEDMKQLGYQVGRKEKLIVLRLLGMNGQLKEMEKVFEDILHQQSSSEQQLLLELNNNNNKNNSNSNDIQKPFNILLSSYQEHVDKIGTKLLVEKSMSIYGDMLDYGIKPSHAATTILMNSIRLGGYTSEMTDLVWNWFWNKIGMHVGGKSRDLEPSLYKEMVLFFSTAGRPEYALEVNDIMTKKNIPRDRKMMVALIHKVGRSGDIQKSMDLLNEMMIVEEINPEVITFNALLDIHAHQKPQPDIVGAGHIYKMMQELGVQPDVITYGTLIDMFAKTGDLSKVRQVYKTMMEDNNNIKPTPHIFSSLIECFVNNDDHKSALEILRILQKGGVKDVEPNKIMYNILIKSYVQNNDIRHAFMLIHLLRDANLKMDARTFTPLLSYFAKRGDTTATESIIDMMDEMKIEKHPYTYTSLVESYAKAQDMEMTEMLFQDFKHKWRPNSYLFNALLYVYVKKNQIKKIFSTYQDMLNSSIKMTEHTYGILMYYYSKRRESSTVEALMRTMQENGITPSTICWSMLMQSYFRTNNSDNAKQVVESMIQSGVEPNWTTWSILIDGLVNEDDMSLAESVMLNSIEHYQQKNQLLLDKVDSQFGEFSLLANISATATINNKKKKYNNNNTNTNNNNRVHEGTIYTQQLPLTIEDLLDKKQNEKQQQSIIPPPYLFTSLIRRYTELKQFDKARDIFKLMQEHKTPFNAFVYASLMKLYKEENRFDIVDDLWNILNNHHYQQQSSSASSSSIYLDGIGDVSLLNVNRNDDSFIDDIILDIHENRLKMNDNNYGNNNNNNNNNNNILNEFENSKLVVNTDKNTTFKLSPFVLSIYIDSLNEQQRYNDIEHLWTKLQQEDYQFDVQNWNRYIVSYLNNNDIDKACKIAHESVLQLNELEANVYIRSKDINNSPSSSPSSSLSSSHSDIYLHRKTCYAFAEVFDIPGYKGMGTRRLYLSIVDHINKWIEKNNDVNQQQ